MYLVRTGKKIDKKAHLWDGKDTACRMYSTGGIASKLYVVSEDHRDLPICKICEKKMSNVVNLRGFYKPEYSYKTETIYGKPKKSKKKRNKENRKQRRITVLKYFGLNDYATNVGICLCIHKETGWSIPGSVKQYHIFISKFARQLTKKRKFHGRKKQTSEEFYKSKQWKELRYTALSLSEGKCQLCGATANDGLRIHVDHVKPRSKFPELELDLDNIGILCEDCNMGKSNYDDFDYRNKF